MAATFRSSSSIIASSPSCGTSTEPTSARWVTPSSGVFQPKGAFPDRCPSTVVAATPQQTTRVLDPDFVVCREEPDRHLEAGPDLRDSRVEAQNVALRLQADVDYSASVAGEACRT